MPFKTPLTQANNDGAWDHWDFMGRATGKSAKERALDEDILLSHGNFGPAIYPRKADRESRNFLQETILMGEWDNGFMLASLAQRWVFIIDGGQGGPYNSVTFHLAAAMDENHTWVFLPTMSGIGGQYTWENAWKDRLLGYTKDLDVLWGYTLPSQEAPAQATGRGQTPQETPLTTTSSNTGSEAGSNPGTVGGETIEFEPTGNGLDITGNIFNIPGDVYFPPVTSAVVGPGQVRVAVSTDDAYNFYVGQFLQRETHRGVVQSINALTGVVTVRLDSETNAPHVESGPNLPDSAEQAAARRRASVILGLQLLGYCVLGCDWEGCPECCNGGHVWDSGASRWRSRHSTIVPPF